MILIIDDGIAVRTSLHLLLENEGYKTSAAIGPVEALAFFKGNTPELIIPFFSTKKDGQGVGLMLIREILINHHYKFSLNTVKPGKTDFIISLDP